MLVLERSTKWFLNYMATCGNTDVLACFLNFKRVRFWILNEKKSLCKTRFGKCAKSLEMKNAPHTFVCWLMTKRFPIETEKYFKTFEQFKWLLDALTNWSQGLFGKFSPVLLSAIFFCRSIKFNLFCVQKELPRFIEVRSVNLRLSTSELSRTLCV